MEPLYKRLTDELEAVLNKPEYESLYVAGSIIASDGVINKQGDFMSTALGHFTCPDVKGKTRLERATQSLRMAQELVDKAKDGLINRHELKQKIYEEQYNA